MHRYPVSESQRPGQLPEAGIAILHVPERIVERRGRDRRGCAGQKLRKHAVRSDWRGLHSLDEPAYRRIGCAIVVVSGPLLVHALTVEYDLDPLAPHSTE